MAADATVANRLNLKDRGKNVTQIINGWFNDSPGIVVEQTMVSASGKQKGIRSILQERGLFDSGIELDDARKLLASQPDIAQQKPLLNKTVEFLGHCIIFYPKFHPEFNYIEIFWGVCKAYTRRHYDYSWKTLQRMVPLAVESVSLSSIRKIAGKSERYTVWEV